MFCPKCGSQNADETTYCRGCGADLTNVVALVTGKVRDSPALAEKQIDLFASGLRGVMIGVGFLIVAGVSFGISIKLAIMGLFMLAFASFFIGTGVPRLLQSRAIKKLREPEHPKPTPELTPGQPEYFKPARSIYETDDLIGAPRSVTENTTTHLKMGEE
ncbi:MAG: zinc ribbon domain-containing protein [Acidobacteriota bacterium]